MKFVIVFLLLFPSIATAQPAEQTMRFTKIDAVDVCGQCTIVLAQGDIGENTADDFLRYVRENALPPSTEIVLNSNGGSLSGGLALGRAIRNEQFQTSILSLAADNESSRCASACAYAFLGGIVRTKDETSLYGVHQFSTDTIAPSAISDAQLITALLSGYLREMGVSAELLEFASLTHPHDITWIDDANLRKLKVLTKSGNRIKRSGH